MAYSVRSRNVAFCVCQDGVCIAAQYCESICDVCMSCLDVIFQFSNAILAISVGGLDVCIDFCDANQYGVPDNAFLSRDQCAKTIACCLKISVLARDKTAKRFHCRIVCQ